MLVLTWVDLLSRYITLKTPPKSISAGDDTSVGGLVGASATHPVASLACPNNEGLAQRETRDKKHNGQVIGVDRTFGCCGFSTNGRLVACCRPGGLSRTTVPCTIVILVPSSP